MEAGVEAAKGIAGELKTVAEEIVLPRRTRERMRRGEPTSPGRFVLDAIDGYYDFYSAFLVYRYLR